MTKLTDEEIENTRTKRTMIVQISHEDWAMTPEDAFALLAIFTRSKRVEHIHTSNYRHSIYIEHDDQEPPVTGATTGPVKVAEPAANVDQFSAATRAVS